MHYNFIDFFFQGEINITGLLNLTSACELDDLLVHFKGNAKAEVVATLEGSFLFISFSFSCMYIPLLKMILFFNHPHTSSHFLISFSL